MPDLIIARQNVAYVFDRSAAPVATLRPPSVAFFETHDAREGRLRCPDQVIATAPDFTAAVPRTNPATGPVFVEGAEPGDVLAIGIEAIDLGPSGFVVVKPDSGV